MGQALSASSPDITPNAAVTNQPHTPGGGATQGSGGEVSRPERLGTICNQSWMGLEVDSKGGV